MTRWLFGCRHRTLWRHRSLRFWERGEDDRLYLVCSRCGDTRLALGPE